MALTLENILLIGSLLLFISIILGKTSCRFGVPTLILFLAVGMLAGSDGIAGIQFHNARVAQLVGVVSLNFILFSGGLDTDWRKVRPVLWQGLSLSTVGVVGTAVLVGCFAHYLLDFNIYEGLLLGAIVSSTDAAAVFSILRTGGIALKQRLRPTLELESGSNDPMAYALMTTFLGLSMNPDMPWSELLLLLTAQMLLGTLLGLAFGALSHWAMNRISLQFDGLYMPLLVSLMLITFSVTDYLGGNGFLAVYLCGLYMGNQEFTYKRRLKRMFDSMAWLMQIALFLTLGLLVNPSEIWPLMGTGLAIALFLILVARPLSVLLALSPFGMPLPRRLYIGWVGLRGAVPIVFATYPVIAGFEHAGTIFNLVFFVSLSSVLLQGTTLPLVARWLGLAYVPTLPHVSQNVEMSRQ